MAITTARDIISAALRKVGVISLQAGESPTSAMASAGLDDLNMMLKYWSTRRFVLRAATLLGGYNLTASDRDYSIGSGGDFDTTCPLDILATYYRDSNSYDYPLRILTRQEYDGYVDKAVTTGQPQCLFFEPGATQQATRTGTVYIYPVPDSADTYTLYMRALVPLTSFAGLTTDYDLPDEYLEAVVYNLAVRVAPDYGRPISAETAAIAANSFETILRLNVPRMVARTDLPGGNYQGRAGNIYTMGAGG